MGRFRFSTDDLPPEADEATRRRLWREQAADTFCGADWTLPGDAPFHMTLEGLPLGPLQVGRFEARIGDVERRARHIAADGADEFHLGYSLAYPMAFHLPGREHEIRAGEATLMTAAEPGGWHSGPAQDWIAIHVERRALLTLVPDAETLLLRPLTPSPALTCLLDFARFAIAGRALGDADVERVVRSTLLDLVGLALGARGDIGEIARERGLRSARLHAVVREIERSHASPDCTPERAAGRLGLSTRYLHDLLHDSGMSFAERVTELRLRRAAALLRDPRRAGQRIIDIAHECGFADVSTFNRRFRARYGDTPSATRAGVPAPAASDRTFR